MLRMFGLLALLMNALLLPGCMLAAVGAGAAGTVAYFKGDLESTESASLDAVYTATEKAVEEMGLYVISKEKDALGTRFVLRDTTDKKITINLTAVSETTTKLSIRVGVFGDESRSRRIYEQIKTNLPS
jgi:hypothetical protein